MRQVMTIIEKLKALMLVFVLTLTNASIGQVIQSFTQRASVYTPTELIYNIQGDFAMIGNTNLTLASYGDFTNNSNNVMQYVDVDGDPSTFNSSRATLEFSTENGANPNCSNIIYAGLYWTGRSSNTGSSPEEFDVTIGATTKTFNKRKLKIMGPGAGSYTELEANPGNIYYPDGQHGHMYSAYIEVTDYVQTHGLGDYTVADMALIEGNGGATGYYGGWGMIVVYENSLMNWRDVTIFDGHAYVQGNTTVSYELPVSGFQAVQSGNVNMKLGLMAGEGDVGISGDYFQIRDWQDNNWISLNHSGNSVNNFFNGSVETGGNARTLNLQNNTGLDIAMFDVPNPGNTVLTNDQTSTKFRYGSTQDTYVIFCIAMAIDAYIPDVEALVSTESINGVPVGGGTITVEPGETIQYSVEIKNQGTEPIDNVFFVVPIPYTTSYVPASISTQVNFTPLPTPNSAYFDPGNGPTGAVVWDLGTLPLPPVGNPDSVLAELSFELKVTNDCFLLMNPDCPPQVVLTGGTTTGVGQVSGSSFDIPFIQGYETSGPCLGEPITEPLILDIDAATFIADSCSSEPTSRDFIFCNYEDASIPYDSIANGFPSGLNFYNTNSVTPSSTEYTSENPFPATLGTVTYFAIPDGIPQCYYTFTITVQAPIETTVISTSQVSCPGGSDGAIDLTVIGGTSPFTYAWGGPGTFSASTEDISGLEDGTYDITITDSLGCLATNSTIVTTIPDVTSPTILCPTDVTVNNDLGFCSASGVALGSPSTGDECGVGSVTNDAPAAFPVGTTVVTWTVVDVNGNAATCTQNVTVNDTEDPTITCPSDITVSNDAGVCGATVTYLAPSGTDNCAGSTTALVAGLPSGSLFPIGTTLVTYEVTDASGNTAQCSFNVTVNDTEDPTISCPSDITVSNDVGVCGATVTYTAPIGSDNCAGSTTSMIAGQASGTVFPVGTTVVTYEVTDASGNTGQCSFNVTVNDTEDPTISCPSDITVSNDPSLCGAVVTYIVPSGTDNCSGSTTDLISGQASGTVFPVGTTVVTYEVTDASGNTAQCSFNVIVNDTEDPTISCPSDITVSNDAGVCGATVTYTTPTGSDNCAGATTSMIAGQASGTVFPVGTTVVTYEVTDASGNTAQCSFNVTVNDTEDPTITCPSDITVSNDAGVCGATVTYVAPSGTDNCAGSTTALVAGLPSGSLFPIGTTLVTYEVTDASGNTAQCFFNVTVNDTEDPMISCPSDITVSNDAGVCGAIVTYTAPIGSDNCAGSTTSMIAGQASGTVFPVGTTVVTYEVTDASGNTAQCSFNVTVNDTEDPTIICPNDVTVDNDPGDCAADVANISLGNPTTDDNCDVATVTNDAPPAFPVGTTTVTWTVTDIYGNSASCTQDVTVNDDEDPSFIFCPSDQNEFVDNSCNHTILDYTLLATYTDNCGATITQEPAAGTIMSTGDTTITLTIADGAGNTETCVFNLSVSDTTAPVFISCPTDVIIDTDLGQCSAVATWVAPNANENCSLVISSNFNSGDVFPVGTTVVTYVAEDPSGNTDTCEFNVIVTDNEAPILTYCQPDTNSCDSVIVYNLPAATDNCGIASIIQTEGLGSGATFPLGTTLEEYEITDIHGNITTCSFLVTVDPLPTATGVVTDVSCFSLADGEIDLSPSNGFAPYTFSWSNGETTEDVINLSPGDYDVTVIDGNMCTFDTTFTINEPDTIDVTYNLQHVLCFDSADAFIETFPGGGTSPYNFSWNNGETTQNIDSLFAGTYDLTLTDNNGCVYQLSVLIEQPDSMYATSTTGNATCAAADGILDLSVYGGVQPYNYLWSNGDTLQDLDSVVSATYAVVITDANGCVLDYQDSIGFVNPLAANANIEDVLCYGGNNGSIRVTLINAVQPVSYSWSNGDSTANIFDLTAGFYDLTITDSNQCVLDLTYELIQPDSLELFFDLSVYTAGYNVSTYLGQDGWIDLTVQGGTAPYDYLWSTGSTDEDLEELPAGFYSVLVTDANDCTVQGSDSLISPLSLEMPNGYSPNDDGHNDYFVINGIDVYPNNELLVYNRWGNLVYSATGYNNEWNGLNNKGKKLSDGTYFVILKIEEIDEPITGFVDLRTVRPE
jgi:gliding motility-associated-like protein/uncharacterized repeat protein (TIGR01451 family)